MEDLVIGKQHPNIYKSPRRKNTIPSEITPDNRHNDENTIRKFSNQILDAEFTHLKPGQAALKGTKDNNIFMSSAIKSITPKVLRNLANRSQQQEPLIKKGKFQQLPAMTNDERKYGSPEIHKGFTEDTERVNDNNQYRETEERGVDILTQRKESDLIRVKHSYKQKLPSINDRKVMLFIEEKKINKRTGQENKIYSLAMGKGEIDLPVPSVNTSIRANSISPMKEPKSAHKSHAGLQAIERGIRREEREERLEGKSYSEDKVKMYSIYKGGYADGSVDKPDDIQSVISLMKKSPMKGGMAFAKMQANNISGGEEEENTEGLSVSLTIAPLRGSQRTVKQIKKKAEGLEKAKTLEHTGKLRKGMTEEKLGRKKKDEDKTPASSLTNFTRVEKKKKKKKEEPAKEEGAENNDLEGWNKNESDLNISKGDVEDEDEEKEHDSEEGEKDNNNEKTVEEKKTPIKEKMIVAALKKSGVMVPVNATMSTTTKNEALGVAVRVAKKAETVISKFGDKEKDLANSKREQAYKEFMLKMNFSFNVSVKVPVEKTFTAYKYFLGKGNNSIMLKSMMKTRWWWVQTDSKDAGDLNFMWTQLKQNKFIDGLKQRRKTPFENLEGSAVSSNVNDNTTANSLNTLDSVTDCESDTAESETKSTTVKGKKSTGKKIGRRNSKKKTGEASSHAGKAQEDSVQSAYKKLFTSNEIMLINSLANHKGSLYREDFEELGKLRKGPATQVIQDPSAAKICNHLESNFHLANKKALLWNMRSYYEATKENVFDNLPLTFHVRNGFEDKEYQKFLEYYNNREQEIQEQEKMLAENKEAKKNVKKLRNLWIVKPGENTNRGVGIHVCNELSQINELVATTEGNTNGKKRTYLIQQYLDRPFLYNKRKFDIRCYILVSCINNTMKGYWYQEGYIRTATKEFSLKNVTNKLIHLTNDAVQKKAEDYGKFEAGNKLSYNDFQKYLDANYNGTVNFYNDMYPQIKKQATDCIKAVYGKMDPYRRENTFEVFGLDFMIDQNLKAWLIEVNTNPDINASSPALIRVIPPMVENALRLTIDQMYPPPVWHLNKKLAFPENLLENNKFELVFDEVEDGPALKNILSADKGATGDLILEIVAEEEDETEEEAN